MLVLKQMTPPFRTDATYPDYKRPQAEPNANIGSSIRQHLLRAFDVAPEFFQQRLCHLTNIFIDQPHCGDGCTSPWSYREHPSQFAPGAKPAVYGRYIALPGSEPPTYQLYESRLLQTLLRGWTGPKYSSDSDDVALTVLAALAHEDGHMAFRDIYAPIPGEAIDLSRFCDGNFFAGSWKPPIDTQPTAFTGVSGRHLDDDVQIPDLLDTLGSAPDYRRTDEMLDWLFSEQRWAGLLAAFTAEHDFVETYRMFVLNHAKTPVRSLRITVPIGSATTEHDIMRAADGPTELARKFKCFAALFQVP